MSIHRLLRKIGIVALREHERELEEFREKCEEFAKDYLDASRGVTLGSHSGFVNSATMSKGGVVIGSMVSINDVKANHIVVAPWAKSVSVNRLLFTGSDAPKNVRAVVRVLRKDDGIESAEVGVNH